MLEHRSTPWHHRRRRQPSSGIAPSALRKQRKPCSITAQDMQHYRIIDAICPSRWAERIVIPGVRRSDFATPSPPPLTNSYALTTPDLLEQRYQRYRNLGPFEEAPAGTA